MFTRDLAIDLGTQNTVMFAKGQGIVLAEPSLVAVERERGQIVAAGWGAGKALREAPTELDAVWPMINGVVADFEAAEQMLARFLRKARRRVSGQLLGSLVRPLVKPRGLVCVPAGATNLELSTVRRVALAVGVRDAQTIEGPLAAAMGAGLPVDHTRGSMIVDVGSGKTEAAVVSMGGIVAGASVRSGGNAMDASIRAYFRREHALSVNVREAERLKIELGSALSPALSAEEDVSDEVSGVDLLSGNPKTILTNNKEICRAIKGCVEIIVEAVRRTLVGTPAELASDVAKGGIVLCGNGARLRLLADLLWCKVGVPVRVAKEPHKCAAMGAGLMLEREGLRHESPAFGGLYPATPGASRLPTLQLARQQRGKKSG